MTSVDRIQGLSGSLAVKTPCRVATTAAITLSGEQTIDAVAVVDGDRVLVKNQTDTTENGIYNVSTGHWTRALDFDGANDVVDGTMVVITSGGANAATVWQLSVAAPVVVGTSAFAFARALFADASSASFTPAGAGAVVGTVQNKLRETISVEDFGAVTQTDSTAAIRLAVAACLARAKPTRLTFPNPPYYITDEIVIDPTSVSGASILLDGGTAGIPTLKCVTGFTAARAIYFGPPAASTTRHTGSGIINFSVDGNSLPAAGGVAGIYIWNSYRGQYRNISVDNFGAAGVGDGITSRGHVDGVAGDPCNQGNVFHNIYARNNGQAGMYFRGEKSSMFDMLVADGNAAQGIFWDSESITAGSNETTENVIGSALAKSNTGAGFAFSGLSKFSVGNLEAYINGGPGVNFVATRSGTTAPSGACSFGSIVSRNNLGAVITDAGANIWLASSDIGSIVHVGGSGTTEREAIRLAGWYAVNIGSINSVSNIGTVLRMIDQTGPQYCNKINIGLVMAYSNGHASAATNHGVSLEGNTNLVAINKLHSANAYTTAAKSSYELVTGVNVSAVIGNLYAYAADAGRELSIGNQSIVDIVGDSNIRGVIAERKTTGRFAASAIAQYGSYANEFWDDSATPRKYARMGDSTLRLLSSEAKDWTPGITFTTPGDLAVTYTTQAGKSIVVGDVCVAFFSIVTSAFTHTTAAGNLRISGLPHAAAATHPDVGSALHAFQGITKANYTQFSPTAIASGSLAKVAASGSGQAVAELAPADMPTGGSVILRGVLVYKVDLPLT